MGRRSMPAGRARAVVAGVAGAALLMTSCSSSDDGDDGVAGLDDGGSGVEEPDEDTEPEEPEPDVEDDSIDRPDVEVAETLEMVFEDDYTGDPVKDAILVDNEWYLKSIYEVITTYDLENSSISFYSRDEALERDIGLVESFFEDEITSAGVMRYFNREVEVFSEDRAGVTYCRDFTQVETVNFKTGETVSDADADALPTYYEAYVELNDLGVWQVKSRVSDLDSKECQ